LPCRESNGDAHLRLGEAEVEDDIMGEEANYTEEEQEPEGEDLNDNFEG
jgi:hypothetical protein